MSKNGTINIDIYIYIYTYIPSGKQTVCYRKWPFIVGLAIKMGGFFHRFFLLYVYQLGYIYIYTYIIYMYQSQRSIRYYAMLPSHCDILRLRRAPHCEGHTHRGIVNVSLPGLNWKNRRTEHIKSMEKSMDKSTPNPWIPAYLSTVLIDIFLFWGQLEYFTNLKP